MTKSLISKLGVSLIAFALVVAPTSVVLAQSSINVSINSPANNAEVTVNQPVTFTGSATGGDVSTYAFNWTWGDGTQSASANNNGQTTRTKTYSTTGQRTVTLRVTDFNGNTNTRSISINVVEGSQSDPLVISNIRVVSKTTNSAVIAWTTNRPATSRVIYDTQSRKDASGNPTGQAPNYGYTSSTVRDDNKVTEHSVTLTGLSANTRYFFRVLSAE